MHSIPLQATQMIKEVESTAGTLGGFSEVYHDNDVYYPNYSESSNTESRGPVSVGLNNSRAEPETALTHAQFTDNRAPISTRTHNTNSNTEMPPVNCPPNDSYVIQHQDESRQSVGIISVASVQENDEKL